MRNEIILDGTDEEKYLQIIGICKGSNSLSDVVCLLNGSYGNKNESFVSILLYDFMSYIGINLDFETESAKNAIKNKSFDFEVNAKIDGLKINNGKISLTDSVCEALYQVESLMMQAVRFSRGCNIKEVDNENWENPDLYTFVPGLLIVHKFTEFVYKKRKESVK